MNNYYLLKTGKIVSDLDLQTAFEIETGIDYENHKSDYLHWRKRIWQSIEKEIIPSDEEITNLIHTNNIITAIKMYKDLYNCSFDKAKYEVNQIANLINFHETIDWMFATNFNSSHRKKYDAAVNKVNKSEGSTVFKILDTAYDEFGNHINGLNSLWYKTDSINKYNNYYRHYMLHKFWSAVD